MIGLDGPVDVVGDEKIQLAVVVIVKPERACGKSRIAYSRLGCHVGKLAIAQIVEKTIGPDGGDVDIVDVYKRQGLDTWQPTDPNDYREMGQIMARVGYVRPDWEKTGEAA